MTQGSVCDFCSDPHPTWMYPAADFEVQRVAWGSEGAWAACEECSQLIEEEHYETLVKERMLPLAVQQLGPLWNMLTKADKNTVELETRRLLNKFRRSRTRGRTLLAA